MIRVLQFADLINRHDFIDNIVQRADRGRFELGVCVRTGECNIEAPVYGDNVRRWLIPGASRRNVPAAAVRLAGILRSWKADILHAHHYDQAVIGMLATRLCPRTRLVIGRHYSDAIYRCTRRWKRRALLGIEQLANRRAERIVVPSTAIAQIVTERQRVSPGKVDCVPYGFVATKYAHVPSEKVEEVREELGLRDRFVIGNFSRLHEEKGHRFLIEALPELRRRIPEVLLLVVGEGPERARLERQIEEAGLAGAVRLLGWRRDAMPLMAAVDAVVQPTLQEAFSQVMAETLWMRKPLVITDVSGATDIIQDGENGLLIPKANPAAIVEAVSRLAGDAALRQRLGETGRRYVEENLTIERIIPRYEQAYLRAVGACS